MASESAERSSPRLFVLDIGGEGRHPQAWNLNPQTRKTRGPERGQTIPRLIRGRGESIPLADRTVDVLIVERTPLRQKTLAEMLRVAKPTATIFLRHARPARWDPHRLAVETLPGAVRQRVALIGGREVQETVVHLSRRPGRRAPRDLGASFQDVGLIGRM